MPGMTEGNVADTAFDDRMAGTETEMLIFAIERSRAQFAWKAGGLDAAGLRKPLPPSAMTLGGLLKHLALVEDWYACLHLTGVPIGPPWNAADLGSEWETVWRTAADDSPEELYALWRGAVERCRAAVARALAGGGPDGRRRSCSRRASRRTCGAS
jgi:hypothetical protein